MLKPHQLKPADEWLYNEVKEEMMRIFKVNDDVADHYIIDSSFLELLEEDPIQVHHEDASSWAYIIAEQHNLEVSSR